MPENEFPKLRQHPIHAMGKDPVATLADLLPLVPPAPPYAELCVTSNYTFLTGASHPEEFVTQAHTLGYRAIGLADVHTIAGMVRAHVAAKALGMQLVIGTRIHLMDWSGGAAHHADTPNAASNSPSPSPSPSTSPPPPVSLCLYPTDMDAYRRMCRLLTLGKRRAPKAHCYLWLADLAEHCRGMMAIAILAPQWHANTNTNAAQEATHQTTHQTTHQATHQAEHVLCALQAIFGDRLSLAACAHMAANDQAALARTMSLADRLGIEAVATNDAHYHEPARHMLADVLCCIRNTCTLSDAGYRLGPNAERHLKAPDEMHRIFNAYPRALHRTVHIAESTRAMTLDLLRYEYPDEVVPKGRTPQQHLTDLAWIGASERYPRGVPDKVAGQIRYELKLIEELNYATYFLTVHDLVRYARTGQEDPAGPVPAHWVPILCQGRGAAANSAVCYCLAVTAVDPERIDVLFERFISKERNEPPDIDIDFEHERREEVIQYIYRKYGRERAALTGAFITYRRRSAVRDVGKALGLSLDLVNRLAKDIQWWDHGVIDPSRLREMGLNPDDPTLRWLVRLVQDILGFPRHASQHVGGFIITRSPLCELVPIENAAMPDRTVIEWDKDDIDAVGILKVDVLALGMLTAIRRCLDLINERDALKAKVMGPHVRGLYGLAPEHVPMTLATVPPEDPDTYAMIQRADTVGVFQIESRAQMSMLPRLKPKEFYDLVIEVAIVRPGPIQGNMVHPYLRRRNGEEKVVYPHPSIEEVLKKTLGVPLFQEQCMALAVKAAGFTPGEADQLRRAMAAWKRKGDAIYRFGKKLVDGMTARGIPRDFAERCFDQIKGFSEYGFPESHAASFAILVYVSCWLKCHRPAEFTCALLNSQPMGFYAPSQLVRDAREHNVTVRGIDIAASSWDCTIEPDGGLRLGLRMISGLSEIEASKVIAARDGTRSPARSPARLPARSPARLPAKASGRSAGEAMLSLWRRSGAKAATMQRLARADAFGSWALPRQQALWHARLLRDEPLPLFDQLDEARAGASPVCDNDDEDSQPIPLPPVSPLSQVVLDYTTTGLSLRAHPVAFARQRLKQRGVRPTGDLKDTASTPAGSSISVAGLVLMRQRPSTANDVTFITIEDESGIANLIVSKGVYQRYRRAASSRLLIARGRVQRQGLVVHVMVTSLVAFDEMLSELKVEARDFR